MPEVIPHRVAFDSPRHGASFVNRIAHKVHAPSAVNRLRYHQWHEHAKAFGLLTFSD
jgi:hypothetical protein